jgi:hypothetical protein
MPTIDLTDAEHAAITALISRAIDSPMPRALTRCARRWPSSIL